MMFIIRTDPGRTPNAGGPREPGRTPDLTVKLTRRTPSSVADSAGRIDHFCLGDPDAARAGGWTVIPVHDGWYADDTGGGVAIWGQGAFWEIRDTPLHVKEACGPTNPPKPAADETPNVRAVIFQG